MPRVNYAQRSMEPPGWVANRQGRVWIAGVACEPGGYTLEQLTRLYVEARRKLGGTKLDKSVSAHLRIQIQHAGTLVREPALAPIWVPSPYVEYGYPFTSLVSSRRDGPPIVIANDPVIIVVSNFHYDHIRFDLENGGYKDSAIEP